MRAPETLAEARRADRVSRRIAQLEQAAAAERQAREQQRALIRGLRRDGVSWARIATSLGTTRQAVQQRFGKAR